jgi:opacity protein-like surface antigen
MTKREVIVSQQVKVMIAAAFAVISVSCFASPAENSCSKNWKKGITLSAGPTWSNPGENQTINFPTSLSQAYVANSNTSTFTSGEIFVFLQRDFISDIQAQVGVAFAATNSISLNGDIWQDGDPDFNNLNYSYKIKHSHIAIRGKMIKDMQSWVKPYLGASLGVGFNRAYNYIDVPKIPEVVADPPFGSHTNTAFTYTLDIGVHKSINEHWSVEAGYEFADWGKTYLGAAAGQTSGTGLSLNHVYTNELQFSLSYTA